VFVIAAIWLISHHVADGPATSGPAASAPAPAPEPNSDPQKQDTDAALNQCVESHDDGEKSTAELRDECSAEAAAWVQDCQNSGGGDENACEVKVSDVITMRKVFERNVAH
jgi:hypothetical protein